MGGRQTVSEISEATREAAERRPLEGRPAITDSAGHRPDMDMQLCPAVLTADVTCEYQNDPQSDPTRSLAAFHPRGDPGH